MDYETLFSDDPVHGRTGDAGGVWKHGCLVGAPVKATHSPVGYSQGSAVERHIVDR